MSAAHLTDALGYLAALLVLAAFCMRDMTALRMLAIASNLAFMAYAMYANLQPILLLHAVLLPVNLWRLLQDHGGRASWRGRAAAPHQPGPAHAGDGHVRSEDNVRALQCCCRPEAGRRLARWARSPPLKHRARAAISGTHSNAAAPLAGRPARAAASPD